MNLKIPNRNRVVFWPVVCIGLAVIWGCTHDNPVSNLGPAPTIALTFPADSAVIKGSTALTASVAGGVGTIVVSFFIDGALALKDSVSPYAFTWDPTALSNGSSHKLKAIAIDSAGRADTTATVTMFANYPKLRATIAFPSDGAAVKNSTPVSVTVAGGAGGNLVTFYIDAELVSGDSTSPFQYSWDPSGFSNGSSHTFGIIAADSAGQVDTSALRTIYANYLPLVATFLYPPDSSVIGDTLTIRPSITGGAGGETVTFILDGSTVLSDNVPPFGYNWDPTVLANGSSHTAKMIVADTAGQTDTTAIRTYFAKWRLVTAGSLSMHPINVRNVYVRSSSSLVDFRIEFDNSWGRYDSIGGIDCAIFLDADQNNTTGKTTIKNSFNMQIPINDIGAEYRMIIGGHGDSIWTPTVALDNWTGGRGLQGLSVANSSNVFECSVSRANIGFPSALDMVVSNVHFNSVSDWTYDWVPTSGHATYRIDGRYIGPPVSSPPNAP